MNRAELGISQPACRPGRTGRVRMAALLLMAVACGCATCPRPGTLVRRHGDEIVVAGQLVHTGTRVVTWLDPGGYDAYRVERRFSPLDQASWEASRAAVRALETPNRYGLRRAGLSAEELDQVRGGGWELARLQRVVDQVVVHYDACGTSRQCFKVLHDVRGLSAHFLLDLDGTIYQTLDLKERAWHATIANDRSVGIEMAHIGAYPVGKPNPFHEWYAPDSRGRVRITIPPRLGDGGLRTRGFVGRPARPQPVVGVVQGQELVQYDFTPEQYAALARLIATLCRVFPKVRCDYPRDAQGRLITHKLPDETLAHYSGLLGHWHVQTNKVDPGPAFQWDWVVSRARRLLGQGWRRPPDKLASRLLDLGSCND